MSLINEALKQASRTHRTKRESGGPNFPPMRYAASARRSKMMLVLPAVSLGALILAGWFAWQWSQARTVASPVAPVSTAPADPPAPVIAPPSAPVAETPHAVEAPPAPSALNEAANDAAAPEVQPVPLPVPEVATLPALPPPPEFPEMRLQGIFYRPSDPTALIDGRILSAGDVLREVRVEKIEPQSVTLEWKGERRVLRLGD